MARPKFPSDEQAQFMLRLPHALRTRIRVAAERNGRSMNSEILTTLEQAYPPPPDPERIAREIRELLRKIGGHPSPADLAEVRDALVELDYVMDWLAEARAGQDEDRDPRE